MSFNPHTHAGCDQGTVPFDREIKVSIHTPTQGVTTSRNRVSPALESFNPHTHAGCDSATFCRDMIKHKFQSTHPRRV